MYRVQRVHVGCLAFTITGLAFYHPLYARDLLKSEDRNRAVTLDGFPCSKRKQHHPCLRYMPLSWYAQDDG